ncbi:hypothetical protein [Exiguobacterium sp. AB2]|uniref:hypothetical protein n=1 Tax=Exiguobacterium sp. AB2 TaxID=1484479 RepID=UPI00350F434E
MPSSPKRPRSVSPIVTATPTGPAYAAAKASGMMRRSMRASPTENELTVNKTAASPIASPNHTRTASGDAACTGSTCRIK